MYISRLKLVDTLGVRGELEFSPGMVITVVTGGNAKGKSSIFESVLYVMSGGYNPAVIHDWGKPTAAKKSIVEYDLRENDSEDLICTVRKTTTAKGATLEVIDANGRPVEAPKTYLESLAKLTAINPSRLLQADTKTFVSILKDVLHLEFDIREEIIKAVPNWTENMQAVLVKTFPVSAQTVVDTDGMRLLHKALYQERTIVNRQRDEVDGAVKRLTKTLPAEEDVNWAARRDGATAQKAEKEIELELATLDAKEAADIAEVERIAELEKAKIRNFCEGRRLTLKKSLSRDIQSTDVDELKSEISQLSVEIAEAKQKSEAQARAAGIRLEIDRSSKLYTTYATESEYLTMALGALEELERRKLEELPIPGLSIREDGPYYNGVPWDQVNTGKRNELVLRICALLHKKEGSKLAFMMLDNTEALDTENWLNLQEQLKKAGYLQFLGLRRTDGPLGIEVVDKKGVARKVEAKAKPVAGPRLLTPKEQERLLPEGYPE